MTQDDHHQHTTTSSIDERFILWLELDQDPNGKELMQKLFSEAKQNNYDHSAFIELEERLGRDITFGTAGLRAAMGPGFALMNTVTVQLATQGVAKYVLQNGGKLVVVGCDHRHNSETFRAVTIATLNKAGLKVISFETPIPTPLVPFTVRRVGADFGIMITASHNPAQDNGYKVYGGNSCQIMSPADKEISELIKNENYQLWNIDVNNLDYQDLKVEMVKDYVDSNCKLFKLIITDLSASQKPKIVYTPLHGVGLETVSRVIANAGLPPLVSVPLQSEPNPEFPTVKFPNPEEGSVALREAFLFAESQNVSLIFANDPDVDRFNCAEKNSVGKWRVFTGNEIAAIFTDFLWKNRHSLSPHAEAYSVITSCVSSKLIRAMGLAEGFKVIETLTGFKHISNAAQNFEQENVCRKVLLAYEEAIGFMVNTEVWDKDGISALLLMYLIVTDNMRRGINSLEEHLESIHDRYGFFCQYNSYFICQPASLITPIFKRLREKLQNGRPVNDASGPYSANLLDNVNIIKIKDYPGSNMITFILDPQELSWITFRASGTEPKIKFYSEIPCPPTLSERKMTQEKLQMAVDRLCELLLEPTINNLQLQKH